MEGDGRNYLKSNEDGIWNGFASMILLSVSIVFSTILMCVTTILAIYVAKENKNFAEIGKEISTGFLGTIEDKTDIFRRVGKSFTSGMFECLFGRREE
jgi:hypothetical protein